MRLKTIPPLLLIAVLASTALGSGKPVAIVPGSLEVKIDVKANVDAFTAQVEGGELAVTADPGTHAIDSAEYTFEWSGVKTGKDKRDHEMLEWADAEHHPKGSFTLNSIEASGDGHVAKGSLEFHGVSKEIEFPVEIAASGTGFKVSGSASFDHRDWGLKQIRKFMVFSVNPTVTVRFKFETSDPS